MGLFKPAWQSEYQVKAERAVKKINNQNTLTRIAKESQHSSVRMMVAEKLIDQSLAQEIYADIALNEKYEPRRIAAADKLLNNELAQATYIDIAKFQKGLGSMTFGNNYFEVLKKITDQDVLSSFLYLSKTNKGKKLSLNV